MNAAEIIKELNLTLHPEGGYYKEIFRAEETIDEKSLPPRYYGNRCLSTSIYFLLEKNQVSKFHRLKSTEIWYYHYGCPLTLHMIDTNGNYSKIILGGNIQKGEVFQAIIPVGAWFGAEANDKNSFTLTGCNVAPGFDFKDFELGDRNYLINNFPQHKEVIIRLT
ncbi:MAG: cupin domain-containing protein [Ignavibacteriales bacterium]|nr:MAG: cupin domain-containing protein [Ignavibacteriales bacterium]